MHMRQTGELRHSGMGIAAFVISLVAGLAMLLLFAVAGMLETATPGGMDEESPQAILIGAGMVALLAAELVAGGLGLAGLLQRDRRKAFAVLGLVFAGGGFLLTVLLLVIGSAM